MAPAPSGGQVFSRDFRPSVPAGAVTRDTLFYPMATGKSIPSRPCSVKAGFCGISPAFPGKVI